MLTFAVSLLPFSRASGEEGKKLTLSHCVVSVLAEVQVPARKSGIIQSYAVVEGTEVTKGQDLAQIDDAEAQVQLAVAQGQLMAAQQQAENDIDVRYAKAAAKVAEAEVLSAEDANRRVRGSVPDSELRRLRLDQNRSVLGIEQAEVQFALTGIEANIARAQLNGANLEITQRAIKSPINGIVVRRHRREGEWVEAGQPLCHVVGLEKMRITGFVNVKDYEQSDVFGREATITVTLRNGVTEKFTGDIGFASPIVQPGGEYRVWVNVENRRNDRFWILRPGIPAKMSIDVAN